jgi:hypothetical protein
MQKALRKVRLLFCGCAVLQVGRFHHRDIHNLSPADFSYIRSSGTIKFPIGGDQYHFLADDHDHRYGFSASAA